MSVNRMYAWNPRIRQKVYKKEAREWLEQESLAIHSSLPKGFVPLNDYTVVNLKFWLSRRNSDSHNYKKLLFDALQHGGVFEDDRYILDCTTHIDVDTKNPRVELTIVAP